MARHDCGPEPRGHVLPEHHHDHRSGGLPNQVQTARGSNKIFRKTFVGIILVHIFVHSDHIFDHHGLNMALRSFEAR